MSKEKPVVNEALNVLSLCGMNPLSYNKWSRVKSALAILSTTVLCFEVILEVVLNKDNSDLMYNFATTIGVYQVLAKMLTLVINRKQIEAFLITTDNFWQLNNCSSPQLKKRIQNFYKLSNRAGKRVIVLVATFTSIIYSSSLIFRKLPVRMYHPQDLSKTPDYEVTFLFECLTSLGLGFAYIGFDYLFIAMIVYIYWEFQVIKEKIMLLPRVDDTKVKYELNSIIYQHNIVLGCVGKVDNIFSMMMLSNLISSIFCLSSGLVTIIVIGLTNPLDVVRISLYVLAVSSQLFVYCFAGTILTIGCEEVTDAVVECDWWLIKESSSRKSLLLIIQRSQRIEIIKAGKLLDLNLETYAKVLRNVFSFFTVFQAVYKKDEI